MAELKWPGQLVYSEITEHIFQLFNILKGSAKDQPEKEKNNIN